jgi:hypothetical protein
MQQGDLTRSRRGLPVDHDPCRFRRDLGLPDDPKAMTLDQLDQLIAYHESLRERYDAALDRVAQVREQIEATASARERDTVGRLPRTDRSPLFEAWAGASAECVWCQAEVQAIGAYAEPLLGGGEA